MYGCHTTLREDGNTAFLGEIRFCGRSCYGMFLSLFPIGPSLHSQKDLMLTMAACLPTYGAAAVGERGMELWEAIKVEVSYFSSLLPRISS